MALALAARNLGTVCKPAGRDLSLGDESEIFIYGAPRGLGASLPSPESTKDTARRASAPFYIYISAH